MFVFIPDGHIRCCLWSVMLLNSDKNKLLSLLYSMLALAHQTGRHVVLMCSHMLSCLSTIVVYIFAHKCLCYRSKHEMTFLNVKWSHTRILFLSFSISFCLPIIDGTTPTPTPKQLHCILYHWKALVAWTILKIKKINWIEMRSILY